MKSEEGEFKFEIGQEIIIHEWPPTGPSRVEIRAKIVDRRKTMFGGKEINEYRIEILEKEKSGRQILLFEKDLWTPAKKEAKMVKLIDSHCHLEEIENLDLAIEKAKSVGVIGIIAVGSDYQSNLKVLEIAQKYSGFVFPALGYHPGKLKIAEVNKNLEFIEEHLSKAVGIGEIGLDYKKDIRKITEKYWQKSILKDILSIAKKYQKPVIIHSRYAWKDAFDLVKKSGVEKAVFHWYSGTSSVLREIIKGNYFLSATPAVEYSPEHRRAIKEAPLEKLLLETDSPVEYDREEKWEAEPADILRSLKATAELKNVSQEEIAQITTNNAIEFFNLPLTI